MKRCTQCKEVKSFANFYTDKRSKDGLYSNCRKCHNKDRWRTQNHKEYARKYNKTDKFKAYKKKYIKRTSKDERKKHLCRQKTNWAIRKGILVRQPCEVGGEKKSHAHHEDYNKPLEVKWLCRKHHNELHNKLKKVYGKNKIRK